MSIRKINAWFARYGAWVIRRRWWLIGAFVLLLALGVNGIRYLQVESSYESYFLEGDPMLLKSDEFKSIFGNDTYLAVLTECDNSFTAEHLGLLRELSNEILDSITYAEKITSLTDLEFMVATDDGVRIEQIVPEVIPDDPVGLEAIRQRAYSKEHLARRIVSSDGRYTWVLLKLRPFPKDTTLMRYGKSFSPEDLTGYELERIVKSPRYAELHLRGAGMPYVNQQKMKWLGREMPKQFLLAILLSIVVMLVATRSFRGVLVPILSAVGAFIIVYGALGYASMRADSGIMMIPILLVFAVAVAYNIHVYSYFRRQYLLHGKRRQAVCETVGEMGWPVLFSALTTFVALLSFLLIPMMPMRFLGIASSCSVLMTFVLAITIMPLALSFGRDRAPNAKVQQAGGHWLDRKLAHVGSKVLGHRRLVVCVAVLATAFSVWGFTRIETAFDVERTMGRRIEYVDNLLTMGSTELGSVYSYDLMVEFDDDGAAKRPENLMALDSLEQHVARYPLTKRTSSVLTILKDLRSTLNGGDRAYYSVPTQADEVAQLLLLYENAGGSEAEYWMDYDYRRLRLMVDISTFNSAEAEREMADVLREGQRLLPNARITLVGNLPQFTTMMQYVARGQVSSFLISLLIIGIMMMIVFGSVRIGLIGLIPNVLPALIVGGIMGWANYPLDMMTATIMPMILGLAVDDTIHFINFVREEFAVVGNYRQAILRATSVVGTPVVLTSLIIAANFAVYMTSQSRQFLHMGLLAVSGVLVALLADLCITPLLFQRFSIFGRETRPDAEPVADESINKQ